MQNSLDLLRGTELKFTKWFNLAAKIKNIDPYVTFFTKESAHSPFWFGVESSEFSIYFRLALQKQLGFF